MSDPKELPPPWARHPEIPAGSIGWRMGYGEDYLTEWHDWLARQPKDRPRRLAYLRRHVAAPRTWSHMVAYVLEPDHEDDGGANIEPLLAEGLVGDDVAMGAWETIHGQSPTAPWAATWRPPTVGGVVRYSGRELTFWARWCARQRAGGQLDAWLQSVPAPEPAWAPLRDAVRDGVAPRGVRPTTEWDRLSLLVAAHGEAPPPWVLGEAPAPFGDRYEDDASYADAWSVWVYEAFDDGPSWRAYLERHGGVPVAWREAVELVIHIE